MNPQEQFCPKMDCKARGQLGKGNIVIHSRKERRYKFKQCSSTFYKSLRLPLYLSERKIHWVKRTPAIASCHPDLDKERIRFRVEQFGTALELPDLWDNIVLLL